MHLCILSSLCTCIFKPFKYTYFYVTTLKIKNLRNLKSGRYTRNVLFFLVCFIFLMYLYACTFKMPLPHKINKIELYEVSTKKKNQL